MALLTIASADVVTDGSVGAATSLTGPDSAITGGNASTIDGLLHVSSADYLALGEQMERFLATPLESEVLSTAAPAAFGFLGSNAGSIQLQGANFNPDQW